MKKFDFRSLRGLPVLLSITAISLTSLVRGDANDLKQNSPAQRDGQSSGFAAITEAERNADLEHIEEAPLDMSDISMTAEDFRALRERESKVAIEEEDFVIEAMEQQSGGKSTSAIEPKTPAPKQKRAREVHPVRFKLSPQGGLKSAWPKCNLFLDAEGEYGSYGRIVKTYIEESLSPVFLSNEILGMESAPRVCPNWSKFDHDMKKKFWVWTMASIAGIESGCNNDVKDHRDVTGNYAFGMYQLERSESLRKSNRRFAPHCLLPLKEVRKPVAHIRCAMDMLVTQLIDQKAETMKFDGRIYPGPGMKISTYFNEFHHAYGGYIGQLMREFKPCYN